MMTAQSTKMISNSNLGQVSRMPSGIRTHDTSSAETAAAAGTTLPFTVSAPRALRPCPARGSPLGLTALGAAL